jgi:hypothetical protein
VKRREWRNWRWKFRHVPFILVATSYREQAWKKLLSKMYYPRYKGLIHIFGRGTSCSLARQPIRHLFHSKDSLDVHFKSGFLLQKIVVSKPIVQFVSETTSLNSRAMKFFYFQILIATLSVEKYSRSIASYHNICFVS